MAIAFIGIGSNIEPGKNIREGVDVLRKRFSGLLLSPVYESSAVGFDGDNFINLVARFSTDLNARDLQETLHEIESGFGRDRGGPRYAARTLDLDLLLYDELVTNEEGLMLPREDISKFAFVLRPLSDIAGDLQHPVSGISFGDMWNAFDAGAQKLWLVELNL